MIKTSITGIGDPFILLYKNKYYMYATSANDGFKYFTSENLTDWTDCGYCFKDISWGECDFWAPEVFEKNGKFYMFFSARWNKNHSLRVGVAVSDSPCGPFKELTDGPLFDYGYAVIDATLFTDDDGSEYLYWVRDCSEQIIDGVHTSVIYLSKISADFTSLIGESVIISKPDSKWETENSTEWHWNEGPAVIKHNGLYYLNYSSNCFDSLNYSVGCACATSPYGPFKKQENNPILKYREGEFSGPGHNCFFRGINGRLYTAFHIHTDYYKRGGDRRACIGEVVFEKDGKMSIII